jgi:hypothetical protein
MDMIIGRFLTPLNSSRTMRNVRAGVTTTRAGKFRMSVETAPMCCCVHISDQNLI